MRSTRLTKSRAVRHFGGLMVALPILMFVTFVPRISRAEAPLDVVGRLRTLLANGHLQEAEVAVDSLLAAEFPPTRADSLRGSDLRAVWIEARLRLGLATSEPAPARIRELVSLREHLFGAEDPELATSLDYLGILQREQGDPSSARSSFQRALSIREKRLGRHPETAKSLNQLATLAYASHDYSEARDLLIRAVEITEATLGPEDPMLATAKMNLARARIALDDSTAVMKDLESARQTWASRLGPEHPRVADCLQSLGEWALAQGDWAQSRASLLRARAIQERSTPGSVNLASTLSTLARLHLGLQRTDSALVEATAAQRILESTFGKQSREAANGSVLLADIARAAGDDVSAMTRYTEASRILAETDMADSTGLVGALEGSALILSESDTPSLALPLFQRILTAESRLHPIRAREYARALMGRSSVLRAMTRFDSATAGFTEARSWIDRHLPPQHPLRAEPLVALAGLARENGDLARARAYADTALVLRRTSLDEDDPRIAESLHLLAVIEKDLGALDSARVLLRQGLATLGDRPSYERARAAMYNSLGLIEIGRAHV